MTEKTKLTRTLTGKVVSTKMNKTAVVKVERRVKHPVYEKYIRRSTKYHVHDEANELNEGDTVLIKESRPLSKTKTWVLVEILQKAV